MAEAGEEQEELVHFLRSSEDNVTCSRQKDTVLHGETICKGCKCMNHFVRMCRSVHEVAEDDEEDVAFSID